MGLHVSVGSHLTLPVPEEIPFFEIATTDMYQHRPVPECSHHKHKLYLSSSRIFGSPK